MTARASLANDRLPRRRSNLCPGLTKSHSDPGGFNDNAMNACGPLSVAKTRAEISQRRTLQSCYEIQCCYKNGFMLGLIYGTVISLGQLREAFSESADDEYLIFDRDAKFSAEVHQFLERRSCRIRNPFAGRVLCDIQVDDLSTQPAFLASVPATAALGKTGCREVGPKLSQRFARPRDRSE